MVLQERFTQVGEVHCLNCGRSLAEVVRDGSTGKLRMQPSLNQTHVQVLVAGRHLLRCARCRGRAFVEMLEEPSEERPASRPLMAGVA